MPDREPRTSFLAKFLVLRGAVRELWIIFAAKILAILAYAVMNTTLVLWLSSGYSNFSEVDIRNPSALAARFTQPVPTDALSQYLQGQISETNRILLANSAKESSIRVQRALVEELNRMIRSNSLYEVQRFAGVPLFAETRQLQSSFEARTRAGSPPSASETAHLNRLLLIDAYPGEISRASSSGLGYSDTDAGFLVAAWSMAMTLCTVLVGSLVDAIGLRKAFLLGFCVCLWARGLMTFATVPWLALGAGLFPLALGEALMTPVMVAAVRRYSTTAQRSISFSLFYVMMNVGFAISGWVFDHVRHGQGEYGHYTLPVLGVELSTYRTLFLLSFLFSLPGLLLMFIPLGPYISFMSDRIWTRWGRRKIFLIANG